MGIRLERQIKHLPYTSWIQVGSLKFHKEWFLNSEPGRSSVGCVPPTQKKIPINWKITKGRPDSSFAMRVSTSPHQHYHSSLQWGRAEQMLRKMQVGLSSSPKWAFTNEGKASLVAPQLAGPSGLYQHTLDPLGSQQGQPSSTWSRKNGWKCPP